MSSIPAVLAALTSLGASTLGNTWQSINGTAGSVTITGSQVFVVGDGPIVGRRDLDSLSAGTTSEEYTVPLAFTVDSAGLDQPTVDALAIAAYTALELAIREFPGGMNLGLAASGVLSVKPTGDFELRRQASADGRHATLKSSAAVYAQNT